MCVSVFKGIDLDLVGLHSRLFCVTFFVKNRVFLVYLVTHVALHRIVCAKQAKMKIMNNENFPHAFSDCLGPESKIFILMA